MKTYKTILSAALCAVMVFSCAACAGAPPEEPEPQINTVEGTVKPSQDASGRSAGAFLYGSAAPLTVSSLRSETLPYYNYVKISGLADDELQNSVNYMVSELAKGLATRTLPPYPSLSSYTEEDLGPAELNVVADLSFACNDILSFTAKKTLGTELFSGGEFSALTVDLRTGNTLTLADIFEAGYDYKTVIDAAVMKALEEGTYTALCTANADEAEGVSADDAFEGVGEDCCFFLDRSGVNVVFDFSTPGLEFEGGGPIAVTVGYGAFGSGLLLGGGCDSLLYTDPQDSYGLLISQAGEAVTEYSSTDDLGSENLMISDTYSYPVSAPKSVSAAIDAFFETYAPDEQELSRRAKKTPGEWLLWNRSAVCTRMGDYYMLVCEFTDNINNSYWETIREQRFFSAQGEELGLGDIFADGFDYSSLIVGKISDALSSSYSRYTLPEGVSGSSLYEQGVSFRTGYDALYIDTAPIMMSFTDSNGKTTSFSASVSVTVNYYDLDDGVLTIFP